jgi:hypothetical protein
MVIVAVADIMCHVATVIMLVPMYVIVVHRVIMSHQNGMSVIASCRAIMVAVAAMGQQARLAK